MMAKEMKSYAEAKVYHLDHMSKLIQENIQLNDKVKSNEISEQVIENVLLRIKMIEL